MNAHLQIEEGLRKLGHFLMENEQTFLDMWEKEIIVQKEESIDLIRKNGFLMYRIITNSIINQLSEEDIKLLAYKVAKERADANSNIGEFVYNVNLGRSIIVKNVSHSGMSLEELQPIFELINNQFDLFCYHAVARYTELKDKRLEEKKLIISQTHKDRLAILGQMSSSFVHEFRNPLTSIMGFIRLLENEHPQLPYLQVISKELEQLKFRITQFLHTSKLNIIDEGEIEETKIASIVGEVIDFLYPSIVDSNIQVTSNIDEDAKVMGNRNELKQVFLNLFINAIDAVCEVEKHRTINIDTKVENNQISIFISNNGSTINAEALKIIFEPFYTTKKLGTGIGLFVCKNIIEKHQGTIQCSSIDEITTFEIMFPLIHME
jgi:signal transduction histidine kinase